MEHHAPGRGFPVRSRFGGGLLLSPVASRLVPARRRGPAGVRRRVWRCMTYPAETASREEAGTLGHQQSLGDGVRAEITFLLQVRLHGL